MLFIWTLPIYVSGHICHFTYGDTCQLSYYCVCDDKLSIKIHVRRAAAEDILKFTCICVCVCIYLFMYLFVSRLLATLPTLQTWNFAHILPLTLSKNGFFVFSIKSPWRPLASKNCRVTWIFRISPRSPCLIFFFPKTIGKCHFAILFHYFSITNVRQKINIG